MEQSQSRSGSFAEEFSLFEQEFANLLHFLEEEWGFTRHPSEWDKFWISLIYTKDDLAIEFYFDARELTVDDMIYRWSRREQQFEESAGILEFITHLSPRMNSEIRNRVKVLENLRWRALKRYEMDLIREWLHQKAELYHLWLRGGGTDLIARARERFGLPPEEDC